MIGLSRTSFCYKPVSRPDEEVIVKRLKKLAETRRRFGCPRLHIMLRREGFKINHKRTERIYTQQGLINHFKIQLYLRLLELSTIRLMAVLYETISLKEDSRLRAVNSGNGR